MKQKENAVFKTSRYVGIRVLPRGSAEKNLPSMQETQIQSLGWEDHLEEGMATHFGILAWRILWTEGSGWLQSIRSHRVRHDQSDFTHTYTEAVDI